MTHTIGSAPRSAPRRCLLLRVAVLALVSPLLARAQGADGGPEQPGAAGAPGASAASAESEPLTADGGPAAAAAEAGGADAGAPGPFATGGQPADAGAPVAEGPAPEAAAGPPAPVASVEAPPPPAPPPSKFKLTLHGSYRLIFAEQSDLELGRRDSPTGAVETLGHRFFAEHQVRFGLTLQRDDVELLFDVDFLKGLLSMGGGEQVVAPYPAPAGAPPGLEVADRVRNNLDASAILVPRQLMVRWTTKYGVLGFGATTFNFGMGLLAHDAGTMDDPGFDRELGDARFGDRVLRLSFATRPLQALGVQGEAARAFTAALAADLVLNDATSSLVRPFSDWATRGVFADRAFGGLLALLYQVERGEAGLIVARRQVYFADQPAIDPYVARALTTDLGAWVLDLAADARVPLASGLELRGAFEGALVAGDTNHVRNDACTGATPAQRCQVLQGGLVARGGFRWGVLSADLLGGYASGDTNPFDERVSNFKFTRDFQAGFILFDQVLAWQSAAMVRRAADPVLGSVPPAGVELLSTNGAVTNAVFLQPTVKVEVRPGLQLVGALLWARAPTAYADVLWTTRTAALTNGFGQRAGSNYGVELDLGVNWKHTFTTVSVHAGLAGGVLLPGDAFIVDETGKPMGAVHRIKLRLAAWF